MFVIFPIVCYFSAFFPLLFGKVKMKGSRILYIPTQKEARFKPAKRHNVSVKWCVEGVMMGPVESEGLVPDALNRVYHLGQAQDARSLSGDIKNADQLGL